jgi:hypothetical protein
MLSQKLFVCFQNLFGLCITKHTLQPLDESQSKLLLDQPSKNHLLPDPKIPELKAGAQKSND